MTNDRRAPQFLSGPAEIPENEITYNENDVLGKGTFGKVYRGRCRAVDVAVKVPKKRRFTQHQLEAFKKEMRIWSRLYHPNICLFMGAYVHPESGTQRCLVDCALLLGGSRCCGRLMTRDLTLVVLQCSL